uniref:WD_REPEATS_REGION domain-containing protein n=1 Tax=Panagrellus redivivus TaxID=6233 RepID=A0A7E4USX7_PANRE
MRRIQLIGDLGINFKDLDFGAIIVPKDHVDVALDGYLRDLFDMDEVAKVRAIAVSPNNRKLAVAAADLSVSLFDEKLQRRDKFATKPVDSKFGKKSYLVTALAFSPDSTKLAIGQTDNIVFVYRLGETWEEKKVICNKFAQSAPVTALIWPEENRLIIGLTDGKVRYASVHSNKCSTIYKTDAGIVALAQSPNRRSFVSGHEDAAIILFSFDTRTQAKICIHTTPPVCLVLSNFGILASGADKRIVSYNEQGRILQEFDCSRDSKERGFTAAVLDPTGYNAVFGSFDRIKLMSWSQRRGAWDEGQVLTMRNFYVVSAMAWKPDGSTVLCGNISGMVIAIDCALKRSLIKNQFETTFVSPSQVIVRDINTDARCVVRSNKGLSITDIRVMGRTSRYVIAYTASTLVLVDRETEKSSEIPWESGGNEKFYLDNENVCMIINAGEISFIEYGRDDIAGWIRTERLSPHLISARLNERKVRGGGELRRVAYLLDAHTIAIVDLASGNQLCQLDHGNTIDWLELNETASKLLYRDVRSSLFLFDVASEKSMNMINFCSYVQWVPKSDVVVAQSGDQLCVWYNTDHVEQVTQIPIQGDVDMVLRDNNRTEVQVQEANAKVAYELDSAMIEFGTAIEDLDLSRAVVFLEESERENVDVSAMWRQLATVALEEGNLLIAQRAYAGLKDISRVKYLEETIRITEEAAKTIPDGTQHYKVRARLAVMRKNFKEAERIYLEQNSVQEAIEMYQKLHRWEAAIELARATNYADLDKLQSQYYRNLYETGQEEKAAEIKEKEGDPMAAIDLFLKSNQPAHAARILLENDRLANDEALVEKVGLSLVQNEIFDKAGELFESAKQFQRALESYRKGKAFNKAIQVARFSFPEEVVKLEEEWGDDLYSSGKYEAAVSHFLEAGNSVKACDAAIKAKEWDKALQILNVLNDSEACARFNYAFAEHFETTGDYEQAEKYFIEAGKPKEAIEMYNKASRWADAYKLAVEFLGADQTRDMYLEKADELETNGRFKEAEDLYVELGEPQRAIGMYKNAGHNEDMIRLVGKYHGDRVEEAHMQLADELRAKNDFQGAEEQYLNAGDWKSAIKMYSEEKQWPDAYRVAKAYAGNDISEYVSYHWAKDLGGDSAVKLLQRHGMLDTAIDMATDKKDFDFGFELCRLGAKHKTQDVQAKYAMQLEDDGEYGKAEEFFVLANKPKEAVLMYMHNQDWDNAERVANEHVRDVLVDVYIGRARTAMEQGDHEKVESYLLRANQVDLIIQYYIQRERWPDVLRIAKEYKPDQLEELQNQFDDYQLKTGAKGAQSYMAQGRDWEAQGDFRRAIETYLKVEEPATNDPNLIAEAHRRAGELVAKNMADQEAGAALLEQIGERLVELGEGRDAGELLLLGNRPKAAIRALVSCMEWAKAKRIASELEPDMEAYVDEAYRDFLKNQGRIGDLIDVDVISAIDILVERGNWEKALETAKQQNHPALLDKYVAAYVSNLITEMRLFDAVKTFEKYGASANRSNFNVYKQLIDEIVNQREVNYDILSALRNMLHSLNDNIMKSEDVIEPEIVQVFTKYEHILHFMTLQFALKPVSSAEVDRIKLHLSVAMVRYIDMIQPDKILYEAGVACRNFGGKYENLAFVFLNHYLDVVDAIEDNDPSAVDNSIFDGTDIPIQFGLPNSRFLTEEEHEDVKEWVLAVSVDRSVSKELPVDTRGVYEGSLVDSEGKEYPICLISGYPILSNPKPLGNGKFVDPANWQSFVTVSKTNPSDQLFDVQQFLGKWANAHLNFSL